jgi:hypothetical protein
MEAMDSHLNRSIVFDRVDLQGPGHKFADHHAASIVSDGVQKGLPTQHKSALVVVKLKVFIHHCGQLFVVAVIRRIKQLRIECLHRLEQLGRLALGEGWRGA